MAELSPYVLGTQVTTEGERLLQQSRALERETRWLLDRIGVQPGWRAVDVGCGPLGILNLLAKRVGLPEPAHRPADQGGRLGPGSVPGSFPAPRDRGRRRP